MSELTPKEARAILDGNFPKLIGMRFEVGQVLELTSRVSVRIEKRNLKRGQVTWDYTILDNRDEVLRRRLPARDTAKPIRAKGESDERYAKRVATWREKRSRPVTATAIEKASHDSHYDGNPKDPMDAGVVVPLEVQNKFSLDARTRRAENGERAREQQKAQIRSLNQELRERVSRGEDLAPKLAQILRELRSESAA